MGGGRCLSGGGRTVTGMIASTVPGVPESANALDFDPESANAGVQFAEVGFMYGPGLTAGIDHWRWGHPHTAPPPRIPSLFFLRTKNIARQPKVRKFRVPLFP